MAEMKSTWLEVCLNGAHSKEAQPNGPHDTSKIIEEALACEEAGASIAHFHAFEGDTDKQVYTSEAYGRIIEGIRKYSDMIVYGTCGLIGGFAGAPLVSMEDRYRPSEELAQAGLLDWMVFDAGLVNFASYAGIKNNTPAGMYLNPTDYLRYAVELANKYNINLTTGVWEPGFFRTALAMAEAGDLKKDIIFSFLFSSEMAIGMPPEDYALDAYVALKDHLSPNAIWGIAGIGADITHLIPETVSRGGCIRVGLEDAEAGCPHTNLEVVQKTVSIIKDAGGKTATAMEIRDTLD